VTSAVTSLTSACSLRAVSTCVHAWRACVWSQRRARLGCDDDVDRPTKINTNRRSQLPAYHSTPRGLVDGSTSLPCRSASPSTPALRPTDRPAASFPARPPHHLLTRGRQSARLATVQTVPGRKRISLCGARTTQPPHPRRA